MSDKSKRLAFLLRHDKDYNFNSQGWREVSDLVKNHGYTKTELKEIVESDNKGRYEFDLTGNKIRAVQGHSIPGIDPGLEIVTPPETLYHGTSSRFINMILSFGLNKQSRNHVHLSDDLETARSVGERHGGRTVVIKINTKSMIEDGVVFYRSANGVYLVDRVDRKYFYDLVWSGKDGEN